MNKNKVLIIEEEKVSELLGELSFLNTLINEKIKPTTVALQNIDQKLNTTVENMDALLTKKSSEIIEKMDVNLIQKEIVKEVVKKFSINIKDVNSLSELSKEISLLIKVFHQKYDDIERILDTYEKRIMHTKHFSRLLGSTLIVLSFGIGALFYPTLLYILNKLA